MNWRNGIMGASGAIIITALLAYGMTRDPGEIPSPLPGKAAPQFALQVMNDTKTVELEKLRGRVVVLNFWASWCLNCRQEHPVLQQIATAYQGKDVDFFGVVYNDEPRNAERWIMDMGGQPYPSLLDPDSRTAIDYGLYGVPETFFISKDGRVAYKHIGPVTPEIMQQWIDKLLAEAV